MPSSSLCLTRCPKVLRLAMSIINAMCWDTQNASTLILPYSFLCFMFFVCVCEKPNIAICCDASSRPTCRWWVSCSRRRGRWPSASTPDPLLWRPSPRGSCCTFVNQTVARCRWRRPHLAWRWWSSGGIGKQAVFMFDWLHIGWSHVKSLVLIHQSEWLMLSTILACTYACTCKYSLQYAVHL